MISLAFKELLLKFSYQICLLQHTVTIKKSKIPK